MSLRMLFVVPLLAACTTGKGDDDISGGGSGSGGDDGGEEPDLWAAAERCTLEPALDADVQRVRVDADGVLWVLDEGGILSRYEAAGGEGCVLEGAPVLGTPGELDTITDFDLDGEGRVLALEFFDLLHRLEPDGAVAFSCEVEAGHTVVPSADGGRAWIISVGDDVLMHAELGSDGCEMSEDAIALERPVDAAGGWTPQGLAMASFDTRAEYSPGVVIDPDSGAVVADLGVGADPLAGDTPAGFSDVVPLTSGFLAAGVPGGDLWRLAADGVIEARWEIDEVLVAVEDPGAPLGLQSIAWSGTGPSYLAAGFLDAQGLWRVEL